MGKLEAEINIKIFTFYVIYSRNDKMKYFLPTLSLSYTVYEHRIKERNWQSLCIVDPYVHLLFTRFLRSSQK